MISDSLFRASNPSIRKKYVRLVEMVKQRGGTVLIFSSLHVSGEQLGQLTGVAAILTYALPDIEDDALDEEDEELVENEEQEDEEEEI